MGHALGPSGGHGRRTHELDVLRSAHEASLAGVPRSVVVAGEAGIGKTRLLAEFRAGLASSVQVARGQCSAVGSGTAPFAAVRGLLRDLAATVGGPALLTAAGPDGRLLTALLPELAGPADAPAEINADQVQDALAALLGDLAAEEPLVVVIEDLHWADPSTLDLLAGLVPALDAGRLTVVLTHRDDDPGQLTAVTPLLDALDASGACTRLTLGRLGAAESSALVRQLRDDSPGAREVDAIVERGDGVPFFLEELAHPDRTARDPLPLTLHELVLARYGRLDTAAQTITRLVAAGGQRVERGLVSQVHAGDPAALDSGLRGALDAGVLTEESGEYTFRHALTHEAIEAELLPGERARLHVRYAAALVNAGSGETARVAQHLVAAGDRVGALPALIRAFREGCAAGALLSAAELGERALALWRDVPDAAERTGISLATLYREVAAAYDETGRARSLDVLEQGLAALPAEDRVGRALLLHETMVVGVTYGRRDGVQLCREALALLPDPTDPDGRAVRARARCGLGIMLLFGNDQAAARVELTGAAEEARALIADSADPAIQGRARYELARALTNLASIRGDEGDIEGCFADLDEALLVAPDDPRTRLRHAETKSLYLADAGRYAEAAALARDGRDFARSIGMQSGVGNSLALVAANSELALGHLDEAAALVAGVRASQPDPMDAVFCTPIECRLDLLRDGPDAAAARLAAADQALLGQLEINQMVLGQTTAEIALARGDGAAAWAALAGVWDDPAPGAILPGLVVAARAVALLRRQGGLPADPTVAAAEAQLRQLVDPVSTWDVAAEWLALFEAELSGPAGTGNDPEAWRRAVDAAAHGRLPVARHAEALRRLAEACLLTGDRAAAADALDRARSLADAHGMTRLVRLADELARRGGLATGTDTAAAASAPGVTGEPLTEREVQVLRLLAAGHTNRRIGAELFISERTAGVHVSAILRKLGAATRTEAATLAAPLLAERL